MYPMDPHGTLEFFQKRQDHLLLSIREIVEIESPSHDAAAIRSVVSWIEKQLAQIPLDVEIGKIEAEGFGEHLVVRAFPSDEKSTLILGHTDTVHPVGTKEKNPTRIDGEKFFGCGIFDMKANIVLVLEVLRYFAETKQNPTRPITVLLSCDEEVGSKTGRPIVEQEAKNAECCLVLEPSFDGKVKTGRKGTGMFTLRAHGVPAHAGLEPEKGASAILELSRQIEKIQTFNNVSNGTTVNACTIKGGTTSNVIPEWAESEIDVRFTSIKEAERIAQEFAGLKSIDSRVSLELLGGINRPPMERTEAVVALYEKARELGAGFDYEVDETQVGGASDGNFVAALGVPVLDGLGIAGAGAHTLHEHVLVSDIAKRATLVALILAERI
ncbi:MAG TPA: M20 family metallopeptidase [Pyrinomonadaceae bacterium]|nr:M20 family metallopeptidase [Pyrinomonadaceae bacterium]